MSVCPSGQDMMSYVRPSPDYDLKVTTCLWSQGQDTSPVNLILFLVAHLVQKVEQAVYFSEQHEVDAHPPRNDIHLPLPFNPTPHPLFPIKRVVYPTFSVPPQTQALPPLSLVHGFRANQRSKVRVQGSHRSHRRSPVYPPRSLRRAGIQSYCPPPAT